MPTQNDLAVALAWLCLASCAARLPIQLDPLQPAERAERRLQEQVAPAPGTGCLLAWGDLPPLPEQRPLRVVSGSGALDVVAVCTRAGQLALLGDRRIRRTALLFFRRGRFVTGHPADASAKSELPASLDARSATLGLFADPHPDGSTEELLRALGELSRRFLVVVWDLAA